MGMGFGMFLIAIAGPPATGKSYLAQLLGKKYELPYFGKDTFKEMMFDEYGQLPDWQTSRFFSHTSIETLKIISRRLVRCGIAHIVEANFKPQSDSLYLQELQRDFDVDIVQVQMQCDGDILTQRFLARAESGEMHPGHQGLQFFDNIKDVLAQGALEPLQVPSQVIAIDTTDLHGIDYSPVFAAVEKRLHFKNTSDFRA
jgi:deoxyadenosine/deoxycytidine kinase